MTEEQKTDRFGLKHLTTNQEVAASFVLLLTGSIYIVSNLLPIAHEYNLRPAFLGIIMMGAAYLFLVESIRELEEKDHFLSEKLSDRQESQEDSGND